MSEVSKKSKLMNLSIETDIVDGDPVELGVDKLKTMKEDLRLLHEITIRIEQSTLEINEDGKKSVSIRRPVTVWIDGEKIERLLSVDFHAALNEIPTITAKQYVI